MSAVDFKECTMCHRSLPLSSFTREGHGRLGSSSWCRDCQRQVRANRRAMRSSAAYDTDLGMRFKGLGVTFDQVARWSKVSRTKLELTARGMATLRMDEAFRVRGIIEGVRTMGRGWHVDG